MVSVTLPRPLIWGIVLLMALGVLLPAEGLPAQSVGCFAVDMNDMPRDCTFLEEHGSCLWNAFDSFDGCMDDTSGFWASAGCHLAIQVDLLACNGALPLRLIGSFIDL